MLDKWYKKEKPIFTGITRGLGGFGFGKAAAAGGGGGSPGTAADPGNGHTASGGIISDYEEGGVVYRSHTFLNPGTFIISQLSSVHPAHIDYLVVGGGGAGAGSGYGSDGQGGGGAGGLRSNHPLIPGGKQGPSFGVSATTYNVEVGLGAMAGKNQGHSTNNNGNLGRFGEASNFYKNGVSYPDGSEYIRSPGGGRSGGFGSQTDYRDGEPGGSGGGGAGGSAGAAGSGNQPTDPNWPQPVGNNGGARGGNYSSGGGGGYESGGEDGSDPDPGSGGAGINLTMESQIAIGYAGGGAGGSGGPGRPSPPSQGTASHGGGAGGTGRPDDMPTYIGTSGLTGTGGGGGGSSSGSGTTGVPNIAGWGGGDGGPGIVVVRYKNGTKNTAKATGGSISFYDAGPGLKAIHTFRTPGTFTATEALDCEIVMIGGGGGGGYQNAGGGGAGGYRHIASHPVPAAGHAVAVGEFGQGNGHGPSTSPGDTINLRNGSPTTFAAGSLAVGGGGSGGNEGPGGGSAQGGVTPGPTGGSSGGGGRHQGSATTSGPYGNDGGNGSSPEVSGGGGGGAGGAGQSAQPPQTGGHGGLGVQLPTTFRDPRGFKYGQGPDNSYWWVAGGGAGGSYGSGTPRGGTGPGGAPSPRCGAGGGGTPSGYSSSSEDRVAPNSQPGMMGTGSGGGGGGETVGTDPFAGPRGGSPGGSGILLIAYSV